jgi:hypothetical protein
MPGFLGGSTGGSSGTGGEILFPKEFIDPVTKLRISQPENLIDTDFEYGLQPTKWETVELINNTPSFFSKSGDTTIPNIVSIATNNGTREITVITATEHGLAVGIPINVTGTKSVTADGSYIINSIPNQTTFTYLCKDNQIGNNAIEDLYSSIITGEFFQGSQIRIADAEGIVTNAEAVSTLTVKTDSTHGFGLGTPFYFLNLNSTISQEFEASNTAAKSFDSSNSATAQTFDGSNTLSTFNIDWSNSATVGGTISTISSVNTVNGTITVTHTSETFANQPLGTPLYYNLTTPASSGFFADNPRGVVFLKTTDALNNPALSSTFKVSSVPDGDAIAIVSSMQGTFQLANQARTFAGNNVNPLTEITLPIIKNTAIAFDGANNGLIGDAPQANTLATVVSYSGSLINVSTTASAGLVLYTGAMVRYSTSGSAASGLTNNTTYFVDTFFSTGTDTYSFTIKALPTDSTVITISGGTGTQTFTRIGVSVDKDIVHIRNSSFLVGDMLKYTFPAAGNFASDSQLNYYFVNVAYDSHNYKLSDSLDSQTVATGGTITQVVERGSTWNVHTFTTVGTSNFVVSALSNEATVEFLLVGGGGGGMVNAGSGGGGGVVIRGTTTLAGAGTYPVVVGAGGTRGSGGYDADHVAGGTGGSTTFNGITATGGGGGVGYSNRTGGTGGNGAGGADGSGLGGQGVAPTLPAGTTGTVYGGNRGGNATGNGHRAGGGAGAGGSAGNTAYPGFGGPGVPIDIDGNTLYYGGGGGGGVWDNPAYAGGIGGGGGGGINTTYTAGQGGRGGRNLGGNGLLQQNAVGSGGSGGANTGGGGGGGTFYGTSGATGGLGGSGIAIIRYRATPVATASPVVASGGTITTQTINGVQYRVHTYLSGTSNFIVTDPGNIGKTEILVVAGGGGGGWDVGGGGGGGGLLYASNYQLAAQTYSVTVGNGGNGATSNVIGGSGGNSSFGSAIAYGGGGGGSWSSIAGATGGSGGGNVSNRAEAHYSTQTNFPGFAGLGNPGGGADNNTDNTNNYAGASGGGGAMSPGGNGDDSGFGANNTQYAFGGAGFPSNIRNTGTIYYSTGGSGAADSNTNYGASAVGGSAFQGSGAANTGQGGGGGSLNNTGGNGGSGIVVIRYPLDFPA